MDYQERAAFNEALEATLAELGAPPKGVPELPSDCVMVTSIEHRFGGMKGGVTMEVGKRSAAEHIVKGTHRVATDDEVSAYKKEQDKIRKEIRDAEDKRLRSDLFRAR